MRIYFILAFILLSHLVKANMASPYYYGTWSATVFSSRDVTVQHEKLKMTWIPASDEVLFDITYTIHAARAGKQLPLLFSAYDYKEGFKVWLDGKPVTIRKVPDSLHLNLKSPYAKDFDIFEIDTSRHGRGIKIKSYPTSRSYRLSDLKYFETDLDTGVHQIKVTYTGRPTEIYYDWVVKYETAYDLDPANYWKSFGSLEVTADLSRLKGDKITNLGKPDQGSLDSIAIWHFNKLPTSQISIMFRPRVSPLAEVLIRFDNFWMSVATGIILTILHLWWIRSYRRKDPEKKYSPAVIIGAFVVPFLSLLVFVQAASWIDAVIGPAATHRHGYILLAFVTYPFILAVYWLLMYGVDKYIRKGK